MNKIIPLIILGLTLTSLLEAAVRVRCGITWGQSRISTNGNSSGQVDLGGADVDVPAGIAITKKNHEFVMIAKLTEPFCHEMCTNAYTLDVSVKSGTHTSASDISFTEEEATLGRYFSLRLVNETTPGTTVSGNAHCSISNE